MSASKVYVEVELDRGADMIEVLKDIQRLPGVKSAWYGIPSDRKAAAK